MPIACTHYSDSVGQLSHHMTGGLDGIILVVRRIAVCAGRHYSSLFGSSHRYPIAKPSMLEIHSRSERSCKAYRAVISILKPISCIASTDRAFQRFTVLCILSGHCKDTPLTHALIVSKDRLGRQNGRYCQSTWSNSGGFSRAGPLIPRVVKLVKRFSRSGPIGAPTR